MPGTRTFFISPNPVRARLVAFACSGRAEMEARLHASGVGFRTDHVPATAQVQLFFQDPAGNGVELNFGEGGG